MGDPENGVKLQQPSNRMSIFLFFVLIMVIVCTAAIAYLNSKGIDIKNVSLKDVIENRFFIGGKDKYEIGVSEIKYDVDMRPEFGVHKGFVVRCTKGGIEYLDKNGEEQWAYPVSLNKPIVRAAGQYLLVADQESKDIYVFSGKEKKWEKELDYNIINADISKSGYVTVIHESERGKNAVTVLNKQGIVLVTKIKAQTFILSSKVSPSGKRVFINCVDTSGIYANTGLELLTISAEEISGKKFENVIFPSMWYLNDDTVVAAGDSEVFLLGKDLSIKWNRPVNGKVFSSNVMNGKYAVFAVSEKDGAGLLGGYKSHVLIVDSDGREVADYKISQDIRNLAAGNEFIAVNTGKNVYFIDVVGQLRGSYNSEEDIKEVQFLSSKEALAITKDSIIVLQMK